MFRAILLALALATVNGLAVPSVIAQRLTLLTEELPPLNFTDQGALTGLSVDVVHEIQSRVGNTDPIEVVPWARGYKDIQEMPNTVLFSTTRTEDRERLFQWVGPLARWEYVFYKKRGSSITLDTLDAARDVGSIATYRDDAREQFLKERGFTNLDSSPKPMSCAQKLLEGRVDPHDQAGIQGLQPEGRRSGEALWPDQRVAATAHLDGRHCSGPRSPAPTRR